MIINKGQKERTLNKKVGKKKGAVVELVNGLWYILYNGENDKTCLTAYPTFHLSSKHSKKM